MFFHNALAVVTALAVLASCGRWPRVEVRLGAGDRPQHFAAFASGDEPQAVRIAQSILEEHGTAADAATALGLSLAVTLPSVAGIGGGGACLLHEREANAARVLRMTHLVSGLRVLQSTYGRLAWPQLVAPAENLARFGQPVSQALAAHLHEAGPLLNDGAALAGFMNSRRHILQAGEILMQPALAETLAAVRTRTSEARDIPEWRDAVFADRDGARMFSVEASPQENPAATGFVVGDTEGNVVACVLTMGRPFGVGRMQSGEGYLLADADAVRTATVDAGVTIARTSGRVTAARAAGVFANTMDCTQQNELGTWGCSAASDRRGAGLAIMLSEGE